MVATSCFCTTNQSLNIPTEYFDMNFYKVNNDVTAFVFLIVHIFYVRYTCLRRRSYNFLSRLCFILLAVRTFYLNCNFMRCARFSANMIGIELHKFTVVYEGFVTLLRCRSFQSKLLL